MTLMSGKRALMEMLKAEGVEYIFGNPGTSEMPIMDELENHPSLKYILVLQEGVAMGMADAYARSTGKPSFVNLHIETGLGNAISLLQNAYDGGTPLVLTAGNKDMHEIAQGRTNLTNLTKELTKWSVEVTHPQQIPTVMRRAFNEAKTPPSGPTFVAFSANALDNEAEMEITPSSIGYFQTGPDTNAINEAARILVSSSNPIMIVGDRLAPAEATSEAVRLAEMIGAEVHPCRYSDMNFPSNHPQFVETTRLGFPDSRKYMSSADVIIAVGNLVSGYTMFSNPIVRFFDPKTELIHINSDPSNVGMAQPTDVGIIGDPKMALNDLANTLELLMTGQEKEAARIRAASISDKTALRQSEWEMLVKERWDNIPISQERMMVDLANQLPADTLIVDDSVSSRDALLKAIKFDQPGSLIASRGGAIGWGIGAGLGAKLANPDKPVVAILGDGGAMMTVQGLWTAANENIPVVFIICNNSTYRVLKTNMDIYKSLVLHENERKSKYLGMDFPARLDMAGIAMAMGVHGRKVENPAEIGPAVLEALNLGKPAVIDVVIDGSV